MDVAMLAAWYKFCCSLSIVMVTRFYLNYLKRKFLVVWSNSVGQCAAQVNESIGQRMLVHFDINFQRNSGNKNYFSIISIDCSMLKMSNIDIKG
jgi:hypothetical protein